jgi:hypothetical protein
MNALGAIVTLILCLMVMGPSPRGAAIAIIAGVCYITQGQAINIGFNFTAIRIILLAGLIRVIARGELKRVRTTRVDKAIIMYGIFTVLISTIRAASFEELVYQLGWLYNIYISYFVFRALLGNEEDIRRVLTAVAFVLIPFALFLVRESITSYNIFSVLGGVPSYSMVREGHVRSEGAFRSPITAGSFGAIFAMLYAVVFFAGGRRRTAIAGFVVSLVILFSAHSSGPLLGLGLGLLALALWRFRRHTRLIRWGILASIVGLHLIMKAPVWFLIGRLSDVVGGGGYHRAYLIDNFINGFGSWWLMGMNPAETAHWFPYELASGSADITNQFVSDGINAGLVGLVLSVFIFIRCFQSLGHTMTASRIINPSGEKMAWGLGALLVCNIGILFSVTYFDQMHVAWYFCLACVPAIGLSEIGRSEISDPIEGAPSSKDGSGDVDTQPLPAADR